MRVFLSFFKFLLLLPGGIFFLSILSDVAQIMLIYGCVPDVFSLLQLLPLGFFSFFVDAFKFSVASYVSVFLFFEVVGLGPYSTHTALIALLARRNHRISHVSVVQLGIVVDHLNFNF